MNSFKTQGLEAQLDNGENPPSHNEAFDDGGTDSSVHNIGTHGGTLHSGASLSIDIYPGQGKDKSPENFEKITLETGKVYALVGTTGSGKSRLISDIEQLCNADSLTKRRVVMRGCAPDKHLIAHLSQNMRFYLDVSVEEFVAMHAQARKVERPGLLEDVITCANKITPEGIEADHQINLLSGGQTRALMIADLAQVCPSPLVLIDEIENAGIDKIAALKLLSGANKLVLMATHDPHTALTADARIHVAGGKIDAFIETTEAERSFCKELERAYITLQSARKQLVTGERLA